MEATIASIPIFLGITSYWSETDMRKRNWFEKKTNWFVPVQDNLYQCKKYCTVDQNKLNQFKIILNLNYNIYIIPVQHCKRYQIYKNALQWAAIKRNLVIYCMSFISAHLLTHEMSSNLLQCSSDLEACQTLTYRSLFQKLLLICTVHVSEFHQHTPGYLSLLAFL